MAQFVHQRHTVGKLEKELSFNFFLANSVNWLECLFEGIVEWNSLPSLSLSLPSLPLLPLLCLPSLSLPSLPLLPSSFPFLIPILDILFVHINSSPHLSVTSAQLDEEAWYRPKHLLALHNI